MRKQIEKILYFDPQDEKPKAFCPVCGGELYAVDASCLRCERRCRDAQ